MEIQLNLPNPSTIANDIERNGLCIYRNVIEVELIHELRRFWLHHFRMHKVDRKFVRGGLFLGEENFNSYSRINEWCMYRYFDFLWNQCPHEMTRQLQLKIHRHRNLAQNFTEMEGLTYNKNNYGIYISTSYYPPGEGFLKTHADGHQDTPILHYMLPLTFKGKDYSGGGLSCEDKAGKIIDVDSDMSIGDIVFFDGRQRHSVERIVPNPDGTQIGRLAIFAIPTFFLRDARLGVGRRSARISMFEIFNLVRGEKPVNPTKSGY